MGELNKKNKINFSLIVKIEKKISNLLKKQASFLKKVSQNIFILFWKMLFLRKIFFLR